MSIEIAVPLNVRANLYFNVEPGTVITREMIDAKIEYLQAYMDNVGNIDCGEDTAVYIAVDDFDRNLPIETYDREKGADRGITVGDQV